MLFNTLQFGIFFVIVYILYRRLNHKWQNRMLLVASYVFYGAWSFSFLSLLLAATALNYYCGGKIHKASDLKRKKVFLYLCVFGNLIILGFFKYCDFFIGNLISLLQYFNLSIQLRSLDIILPIGISFYILQSLGYTIDVYRKRINPTKRFLDFALFVAFFPQLMAGPIERAAHLLPQISFLRRMTLTKFYQGCYLIFWGLFLKVVIADNLAKIVNVNFAANPPYDGVMVLLSLYAFAFQIFCDFAGYSNIARGLGKVMGFDIMINFNLPYFAKNPKEFWQRWHISLSSWFRDYVYIPLGGSRKGQLTTCINLSITMLLCGLWHGAAWTFVAWGAYHGALLIVHRLLMPFLGKLPSPKNVLLEKLWTFARTIFFFHLICLGWLIFRAESIRQAYYLFRGLISNFSFSLNINAQATLLTISAFVWALLAAQLMQHFKRNPLFVLNLNPAARVCFYTFCLLCFIIFGVSSGEEFIYFSF